MAPAVKERRKDGAVVVLVFVVVLVEGPSQRGTKSVRLRGREEDEVEGLDHGGHKVRGKGGVVAVVVVVVAVVETATATATVVQQRGHGDKDVLGTQQHAQPPHDQRALCLQQRSILGKEGQDGVESRAKVPALPQIVVVVIVIVTVTVVTTKDSGHNFTIKNMVIFLP